MKTNFLFPLNMAAMCLAVFVLTAVVSSCKDDDDDTYNAPYSISGDADGSQMIPAVTGTGTGTISGNFDPSTRELAYTSNWNGLTGAPTSAGFFNGASGSAGTAVGSPWTFEANGTGTGTISGSMNLTQEQATQLTNGTWYYSFGTSTNPGGEIRGQITATR
jgi:hypothetical protein